MRIRRPLPVVALFVGIALFISLCLMSNIIVPAHAQDAPTDPPPPNTEVPPPPPPNTEVPPPPQATNVPPPTNVPPTNIPATKIPSTAVPTLDPCSCTQTAAAKTANPPTPTKTLSPCECTQTAVAKLTQTNMPPTSTPVPGSTRIPPTATKQSGGGGGGNTPVPPTSTSPAPTAVPTRTGGGNAPVPGSDIILPSLGGNEISPSATPGQGDNSVCVDWMVYHTNQTGDWEIFRLGDIPGKPAASANLSQGVGENIDDIGAALSPNKQWVAFSSNRDGNFEIYIATTDGASRRRITRHPGFTATDPVWSPDGVNIVYESNMYGNWDLIMVNAQNGRETRLTKGDMPATNAAFSPDGSNIVFQGFEWGLTQIYRLNIKTKEVTKLSDGTGNDRNPTYSSDGRWVAYYSFHDGPNSTLYIMGIDGSNPTPVSNPQISAINHSWSPDASMIAYQGRNGDDLAIYVYQLATQKTRRVTDASTTAYAPTWYCRGNTLIFTSDVTGSPNVFSTAALPIDAPPIRVDEQAIQLTAGHLASQYAESSPPEEDASSVGPQQASVVLPSLGGEPSNLQCGDIARVDLAGGGAGFPVLNTNNCNAGQ